MKVTEHPSLRLLNTFGVEASAALRIDIESEEDILALPPFDPKRDLLLGGGSNILLVGDVPGSVFVNRIRGRQAIEEDPDSVVVEIGAGENWHDMVSWSLDQGLSGLENLALIPGSAGAAPIQNIGAYGVEIASRVDSVTAWDMEKQSWNVIPGKDCGFAYRDSRFKSDEPDRFLITSLRLRLDRRFTPQLDYPGLAEAVAGAGKERLNAKVVFDAVVRIRNAKLPDPLKVGNAGSFFKNPVVETDSAQQLVDAYPELPHWPAHDAGVKLSAAWMIQYCGLKGFTSGTAGVSDQHALVLVNLDNASGQEIWSVAERVRDVVGAEFGITLEPEPRIVHFPNI